MYTMQMDRGTDLGERGGIDLVLASKLDGRVAAGGEVVSSLEAGVEELVDELEVRKLQERRLVHQDGGGGVVRVLVASGDVVVRDLTADDVVLDLTTDEETVTAGDTVEAGMAAVLLAEEGTEVEGGLLVQERDVAHGRAGLEIVVGRNLGLQAGGEEAVELDLGGDEAAGGAVDGDRDAWRGWRVVRT